MKLGHWHGKSKCIPGRPTEAAARQRAVSRGSWRTAGQHLARAVDAAVPEGLENLPVAGHQHARAGEEPGEAGPRRQAWSYPGRPRRSSRPSTRHVPGRGEGLGQPPRGSAPAAGRPRSRSRRQQQAGGAGRRSVSAGEKRRARVRSPARGAGRSSQIVGGRARPCRVACAQKTPRRAVEGQPRAPVRRAAAGPGAASRRRRRAGRRSRSPPPTGRPASSRCRSGRRGQRDHQIGQLRPAGQAADRRRLPMPAGRSTAQASATIVPPPTGCSRAVKWRSCGGCQTISSPRSRGPMATTWAQHSAT